MVERRLDPCMSEVFPWADLPAGAHEDAAQRAQARQHGGAGAGADDGAADAPTTIGLDLAKSVFQVHGVDADGAVVLRRQFRRSQVLAFFEKLRPCLVGMEACSGSHHWARELAALGHEVRLMPAAYVKPYVKRGKTDAADAEAICEAVTRPTMRFVPVKSAERQAALLDHKAGTSSSGSRPRP
jgi:hypothetical protein